jgi:hypothetical protein
MVAELQTRTVCKTPWLSSVKVNLHVGNIGADKRITLQLIAMVQVFCEIFTSDYNLQALCHVS